MSKTVLLLDGDVFAYEAASVAEHEVEFPDGIWVLYSDFDTAFGHATRKIERLKEELKADEVIFTWSCPTGRYWRHDILPTYKGNRKGGRKPMALRELKEALAEEYESVMRPNLEADDVMGILATNPKYKLKAKKIIVSIDKDMQTIPGWLFNPDKDYQPWEVSREHADRFHLAQALAGDQTDGYPGCPQVGFDTALDALENLQKPVSYEHTFKSGKRKDTTETRWTKDDAEDMWDVVKANFERQGLNEEAALLQARVSRILRHGEWNTNKQEVKLYDPRSD